MWVIYCISVSKKHISISKKQGIERILILFIQGVKVHKMNEKKNKVWMLNI